MDFRVSFHHKFRIFVALFLGTRQIPLNIILYRTIILFFLVSGFVDRLLFALEVPKQKWFLFIVNKRPEIVHPS